MNTSTDQSADRRPAGMDNGDVSDALREVVPIAFALGWQMSELYAQRFEPRKVDHEPRGRLPNVGSLEDDQRVGLGLDQIEAACARVGGAVTAGVKAPNAARLRALYEDPTTTPEAGRRVMYALHVEMLQTLNAADFRLGKAYGLGRALADSCRPPQDAQELAETFGHSALDDLRAWLNDSASALPPHSARAVLQSLTRWEAWTANHLTSDGHGGVDDPIDAVLRRQGELWRAVLSGEKSGTDMLTADDYRRAAGSLVAAARRSIARGAAPYLLGGLAALGLILVLVFVFVSNGTSQLITTLAGAAGALGITWKSASTVLQRLGARVERPLWGAELDGAIALAVTYLPPGIGERDKLLDHTPLCLRALDVTKDGHAAQLAQVLSGRRTERRRRLSPADGLAVRWRRLLRGAPSGDDVRYWLHWATAAGYVQPSDGRYQLTEEGMRLARIRRREAAAALAALSASRPSAGPAHRADGRDKVAGRTDQPASA